MPETAKKPTERPGSGERFLINLAYLVPGYRGYKDRELRQDEDARLRSRVLARLREMEEMLEERLERTQEVSLRTASSYLEDRIHRVDTIGKAVRFAPYGFAGFFDAAQIREERLDQILEQDLLLFQELDDSGEFLRGTPFPPGSKSGFARFFQSLDTALDRIERRLVLRDKLLGSAGSESARVRQNDTSPAPNRETEHEPATADLTDPEESGPARINEPE